MAKAKKQGRVVRYTAAVAHAVDALVVSVVADLSGATLAVESAASTASSTIMTRTVTLMGRSHVTTATTVSGCVKLVAAPELWSPSTATTTTTTMEATSAQLTSWMQAAEQTLGSIVRKAKKDPVFVRAVADFGQSVDTHLYSTDATYLNNSNDISACDICVAIWLASAVSTVSSSNTKLPQQAYRWVQTVLHATGDDECITLAKAVTEGALSPATRTLAKPKAAASAAATEAKKETKAEKFAKKQAKKAAASGPTAAPAASAPAAPPPPAASGDNAILSLLQQHNIEHTVYDHAPCMTADELIANVPLQSDTETHTKNLFLRDKKHGLFLITVATASAVNTKELGTLLKLSGKVNLRMADAQLLRDLLKVEPGHVGPLCMAQARDNPDNPAVTLVLDQSLVDGTYTKVHSHPGRNDQSVPLAPAQLQSYLTAVAVEPTVVVFAKASAAAATPSAVTTAVTKAPKPAATKAAPKVNVDKKTAKKGETLLALQWKKKENFAMWYTDVIVLSEMISYYDISGCYILRPWSYKMWELMQVWFNMEIEKMGVENTYFPLFVSQDRLEKEKDHVEGFAPEVAWVTKSGDGDLAQPIAVRPTSETIMYPAFSDWIKSHRDLPLKLNQWSNVVRWEFKYPTPFLRTREFLWQEGHTAHATFADADKTVMQALELYRRVYEELLAVPVVPGYKTEKEKFAGGASTTTVEAYIAGSGRAIQGATSHNLGQNFGNMFDIRFQDEQGKQQTAWQTSWGLTTRTIGVMVMVHGDDIGLVLPPRVAPLQVVIVPIVSKKLTAEQAAPYCESILADLKAAGVRAKLDDRTIYNPGWKYNHWEQKGVPVRVEVGPRDIEQGSARIVVRHSGDKEDMPVAGMGDALRLKLISIQDAMFTKAVAARDEHLVHVTEWKDFVPNLEKNNLVLTPWCGGEHQDWEEWVKTKSREESLAARGQEDEDEKTATSVAAKTLCIPFKQPDLPAGTKCIASGKDATCWCLWGRSY